MCILDVYTLEVVMGTARVFRSGNSQAVRLPKQFRLKSKEVEIFRRGDEIVLREKDGTMVRAFDLLAGLPDDLKSAWERPAAEAQGALDGASLSAGHQHLYLHPPGKARGSLAALPQAAVPAEAALSVITYGELIYGAAKSAQRDGGAGQVARTASIGCRRFLCRKLPRKPTERHAPSWPQRAK